jgi:RNA polymerase sigma-70 factor (ECF subfamily)
MSDDQVIERVLRGETGLYAILILRYQGRLHSTIYPILHNEAEVEDAIQEGHVRALAHLSQFGGRSSFLTWMTRIMVHEALGILRRRRRVVQLGELAESRSARNPEQQAIDAELRAALAHALRVLPEPYRAVFMLREIEEVSTADAAELLGVTEECVRIRLHRARLLLRRRLAKRVASARCRRRPAQAGRATPAPGVAGLP